MDLLNQNQKYNSKPEKSSGSKMITTLIIICVILLIIVLALMFYLKSMQAPKRLLDVNGTQMEMAQGVMISDTAGNEYISLKDLSDTIGYKYNNGAFREYEEDKTKGYIDNNTEIIGFTANSSKIYKTTEDSEIDYEYYKLDHNILTYQDKLYIAVSDISKALNIMCDASNPAVIAITTPESTVKSHTEELKKLNYTLTTDKKNLKAMAYGMLVASRDDLWGALNPTNYQEIIGNKYKTMEFDEYTGTYIVSNERGQYGIITTDGSVKVALKYDSLRVINHEPLLYEVSKDKKYGIMKRDGSMLTEIEYDRVGYMADAKNKINYSLIVPDLDEKTGRTVIVCKDGKYGLIYLSNGKTFIECQFADKIYEIEELGELKYKAEVEDKTYSLEEYIQRVKTETLVVNENRNH